jgi:hypothetical protein
VWFLYRVARETVIKCMAGTNAISLWRNAMKKNGDEIEVTTEEASGGVTQHGVRYVLAVSLIFAVLALSFIWIKGTTL